MGNARKTVLRLLTRLENSGSYSNILLDEGLERSDLSPQDKKFAAALFYGVLERQITLDNIIREYSRSPKNKLGTEVRVILRMGLYQLLYMDSVPDNAAVDESVKLAKKNRNPAASGFVNAMLREFIRNDKKLPKGRNATEELSIEYSAPVWLTEKWTREYGKDICLEMLKTSVGQAPVTARVNTVFHSLESTLDMLAEEGITFERLSVLPDCIRICGAGAVEHDSAIARVLFFVERHWNELLKFSRRTQRQLERWAARYGYKDHPTEMMEHVKKGRCNRYTCVNLTNEDTIEFRIFRGTLKYNTLIATLQMVNRICDVAICMSDDELRAMSWSEFVSGVTEPELIQYLKERRLYLNEPVAVSEEV